MRQVTPCLLTQYLHFIFTEILQHESCDDAVYQLVLRELLTDKSRLLFIGHIGKLVKVAGGVRNTHSRYGDRRMEILSGIARDCCSPACSARLEQELASCVSTDEAVRVLQDAGAARQVLDEMTRRICRNMQAWAGGMQLAVIVFSNVHGVLGQSDNALPFVQELRAFCAQRKED